MASKRLRRTAKEAEAFRLSLIEAARQLFVEQGFEAVSIRKIADRAGCPPMTFYVYFRNKRELLRYIWTEILTTADERAAAAAATFDGVEEALTAYASTWCDYWTNNPDNFRVVFLNQDRLISEDDVYFADSSQLDQLRAMRRLVERGVAEGVFSRVEPAVVAQTLLTTCIGLCYSLIMIPEYSWHPTLPRDSVRLLLRGLKPEPFSA